MTAATLTKQDMVDLLAAEITRMNTDWMEGRSCSPDQRDYVIAGDRLLARHWGDAYIGSTEEGREFVADELFEDCGEKYVTAEDHARFIIDALTAE